MRICDALFYLMQSLPSRGVLVAHGADGESALLKSLCVAVTPSLVKRMCVRRWVVETVPS